MPTKIDLSCLQFKSIHAKLMDSMVFFRGSGMALLLCFLLDAPAQDTLKVYFRSDSAVPLNVEVLEDVKKNGGVIELLGHTDIQGSEAYNLRLSQRRIDAVRAILKPQKNAWAEVKQIKEQALGETRPVSQNDALNRRVEVVVERPSAPPQVLKPPRKGCQAHFSGGILGNYHYPDYIEVIFDSEARGSEWVGEGEYPINRLAFPNSVENTFDGIAADKGTRVILYEKEHFGGRILADLEGPFLLTNVIWADLPVIESHANRAHPVLDSLIPRSRRLFSSEDMHGWSFGSVKVICSEGD